MRHLPEKVPRQQRLAQAPKDTHKRTPVHLQSVQPRIPAGRVSEKPCSVAALSWLAEHADIRVQLLPEGLPDQRALAAPSEGAYGRQTLRV